MTRPRGPLRFPQRKQNPTKEQCELWHWTYMRSAFSERLTPLIHLQCSSLATMDSIVPGGIPLRVCEDCYKRRQEATSHE